MPEQGQEKKIRPVVACIFSHTRPTNANVHRGAGYNNIDSSIEQLPIFFQDLDMKHQCALCI